MVQLRQMYKDHKIHARIPKAHSFNSEVFNAKRVAPWLFGRKRSFKCGPDAIVVQLTSERQGLHSLTSTKEFAVHSEGVVQHEPAQTAVRDLQRSDRTKTNSH